MIRPEKLTEFNAFFHDYLLPSQIKNGAKLIGRWVTESKNEVVSMWEYPNYEEYLKIEERVKKDDMHHRAQVQLLKVGNLFIDMRKDFLSPTGIYNVPKQNVTVSGYITNENNETLLVKTYWRSDTWELPGGGVDDEETLDVALSREIFEETGLNVTLDGITGAYSNGSTISIVFCGKCIGGRLTTSDETESVRFVKINSSNVSQYIKRAKFIPRVLDAMNGKCVPYEAFKVRPYELVTRLQGTYHNRKNTD
ncbi:NUDIX domain-containing protein [Virgibacillus byunsanensis]|uniref:NUDIX domain-containing protein n=1 Tax=Virgibacillus byunsanensis TaxID=570945 RepID=A0ABW3LQE7_9BACI